VNYQQVLVKVFDVELKKTPTVEAIGLN